MAFIASFTLLMLGCGGGGADEESPAVARFKDKVLTQKQLQYYVPDGVDQADSARYAKQFIKQWVKEQAICDKAIAGDEALADRVKYKVEDYEAKLIMHEYHTKVIETSLKMDVNPAEIQNYYENQLDNFRSKETQFSYFYLVTTEKGLDKQARWMRSSKEIDLTSLRDWAAGHTLEFKLDSSYSGQTRINQIAKGYFGNLKRAGKGQLIRWNGVINGVRRRYMFKMLNVVEKGEHLPLNLCEEKIRGLLLNERKVKLIEDTEQKIVKDAESKNYIRY